MAFDDVTRTLSGPSKVVYHIVIWYVTQEMNTLWTDIVNSWSPREVQQSRNFLWLQQHWLSTLRAGHIRREIWVSSGDQECKKSETGGRMLSWHFYQKAFLLVWEPPHCRYRKWMQKISQVSPRRHLQHSTLCGVQCTGDKIHCTA